jgi:hypothetical protein
MRSIFRSPSSSVWQYVGSDLTPSPLEVNASTVML